MDKNGRLHAAGDLERRVREWWSRAPMTSTIKAIFVLGDGGVRVEWEDAEEAGSYGISFELLYEEPLKERYDRKRRI